MIFKLTFTDDRTDWCTAKSVLHLIKSYDAEFDCPIQEIEDVHEISDLEAKNTMVANADFDEEYPNDDPPTISLFELAVSDEFSIIASTEFF